MISKTAGDRREELFGTVTTPYEPANLNSTAVYRKIRQVALDKVIGYDKFKSLSISNRNFITHCGIRKFSENPFHIFYWTDRQVELWNRLQSQRLPLSIDATGSLVKRHSYNNGIKSKSIFYYVLVIGVAGKIIPLLQGLLSIHYVSIIQELLSTWIESGAKVPKEICTDGCLALQIAINIVFNKMTYKQYNLQCYKVLRNQIENKITDNQKESLPTCYYRHDIAHLLHAVKRWKVLLSNTYIGVFYLRCIGYLTQVKSLKQFEDIVASIIIISQTKVARVGSQCAIRHALLTEIFETFEYDFEKFASECQANDDVEVTEIEFEPIKSDNELTAYINGIFNNASKESSADNEMSDQANFYYCPDLITNFKALCYTFPSWTNVMLDLFGSPNDVGTSARSEAFFKRKKEQITNPITVKKFLLKDKNKIDCLINFGFMHVSAHHEESSEEDTDQDLFDIDLESLQICENDQIKISSHTSLPFYYGTFFPSNSTGQDAILDLSGYRDKHISLIEPAVFEENVSKIITEESFEVSDHNMIPDDDTEGFRSWENIFVSVEQERELILNGNQFTALQNFYTDRDRMLRFKNTCPYDSLFEIFVSMYLQNESFKINVDDVKLEDLAFLSSVSDYCIGEDRFFREFPYADRATILHKRYKNMEYNLNNTTIDCNDNISAVFRHVMKSLPSITEIVQCSCGFQENKFVYTSELISLTDFFSTAGLKKLQSILDGYFIEKIVYCSLCKMRNATLHYEVHSYLALDVEFMNVKGNINLIRRTVSDAVTKKMKLDDIPKSIVVNEKRFELKGVACFEGQYIPDVSIVHYKSFVLESLETHKQWKLYDDTKNEIIDVKGPQEEYVALIIFAAV